MQPTQRSICCRTSSGTSPLTTTSETAKRPPGLSTRNASLQHPVLVRREIDDAVRDDDVDRVIGKRDVLDFALEELDVFDARLLLVLPSKCEHLVGHVETVGFSCWADALCGKKNVDTAAGAEVENRFTGIQRGERGGIAAAKRGQNGFRRQAALLRLVVQVGGDWVNIGAARSGGSAAGTSTGGDAQGSLSVFLFDDFFNVFCVFI